MRLFLYETLPKNDLYQGYLGQTNQKYQPNKYYLQCIQVRDIKKTFRTAAPGVIVVVVVVAGCVFNKENLPSCATSIPQIRITIGYDTPAQEYGLDVLNIMKTTTTIDMKGASCRRVTKSLTLSLSLSYLALHF